MADAHPEITPALADWIGRQRVFFAATAVLRAATPVITETSSSSVAISSIRVSRLLPAKEMSPSEMAVVYYQTKLAVADLAEKLIKTLRAPPKTSLADKA